MADQPDYDALAKQSGALSSTPESAPAVDYDALAKQNGSLFSVTATAKAPESLLHRVGRVVGGAALDALEGVGSGVTNTALGAYNLARKIPGADHILPEPSPDLTAAGSDQGLGAAGKIGRFVEQGAEFLVPMGEANAAIKGTSLATRAAAEGAPLATRLAATGARVGAEAATAGATSGVQTGGDMPAMAATAATTGALGAAGAALPPVSKAAVIPLLQKLIDSSPRALSDGAIELAAKFGVPLTRGMEGGSRTVQAAEKMLGHTVAPDLYEPMIEAAQKGVNTGAKELSGGFATDQFSAGEGAAAKMLAEAKRFTDQAHEEYGNLAKFEADPSNIKDVQVGTKGNPSADPTLPDTVPVMEKIGLPVDMRSTKQSLAPLVDEISRRMPPAEQRADPGLAAIKNILSRPDYLPASVAEADLGYLKEIMRSGAPAQAKRLAAAAINSMDAQIKDAVSQAGPQALASLNDARGAWQARSEILDTLKELSGDETGKTGQTRLTQRLLQPSDASFPALQKVLLAAPDAADDLGKAYLTERVFKSAASGEDFTNPKQAANLWNHIGPRTKAALYSPEQIANINDFLELAKRVAENPNPSGTGTLNAMLKMGVMVTHPGQGLAAFGFGRNLARVLYSPEGAAALRTTLTAPGSSDASRAMLVVKSMLGEGETANTRK